MIVFAVVSCVQHKAEIDHTLSEGIVWPGSPEKPRIKYLWSLQRIAGAERLGRVTRIITGEVREWDEPRYSNFLVNPQGIFVDGSDVLYIADPGALRVSVIDLKTMNSFNIWEAKNINLFSPVGVVAGTDGRIYVTDSELANVFIFDAKGKYLSRFDGTFERPTGIAINNEKGLIYVADTYAHKIYIYGLDGRRLGAFGERGEDEGKLNYPTHIALDKDGLIYVSDTLNFKVQIFGGEGESIASFGLIGDTFSTFDKMKGIAVDSFGHIYISDSAQDMVKIFDIRGRLLLFFGKKGRFYGDFFLPTGIYIDKTNRIFVADALNGRIQVFKYLGDD